MSVVLVGLGLWFYGGLITLTVAGAWLARAKTDQ